MNPFDQIINALQPELICLVVCAAIAGAAYLYQWALQRLPANVQKIISVLARTVAQAVEQKYSAGDPGGAVKKQEAMTTMQAICQGLGLPFDAAYASAEIEAAVYMINLLGSKAGAQK
jgi:hypothetical protein